MDKAKPLLPEELGWRCRTDTFSFNTTDDLSSLQEIVGQERAMRSIEFGLGVSNHKYNVFVLGESGTGKSSTVKEIISERARHEPVPDDWCYVFNFSNPDCPTALRLPPGKGGALAVEMDALVEALKRDIPRVFESKDYEKHRDEIIDGQQERTRSMFLRLEQLVAEKGLMLKKSASGLSVVPATEGKPMAQEVFNGLPSEKREELERELGIMQDKLSDVIRDARVIDKETKDRVDRLDREVVQYVVNPLVDDMLGHFKDFKAVVEFLYKVKENLLENIDDFRPRDEMPLAALGGLRLQKQEPTFERYMVNVLVNNKDTVGAPVIYECNPTYYNLFGRVEYRFQLGGVGTTDFTMVKAGSAHKANGGYLVVNALDVLRNIFVYDAIKRMIKEGEVRIEDVWEQYRLVSSTTLKPEPIPTNIKLVMIGEPFIYYLLYNLDNEYRKLFKVKADFENFMERSDDNIMKYAMYVATRCREEGLLPFDRSGVGKVVEHGCRLAGDKEKLSTRFNEIKNMVVESNYWAKAEGAALVTAAHVEKAEQERIYRHSRIEDRYRDYITQDTIMVDTDGAVVGQVNGLAVLDPGDYAFGKPSRITARTYIGEGGVFNIEREVKMSGKIHNKAMMILTSFLGDRFAREFPLKLSASVTFEQLYDEVEGDSATCTEVYALLSSLSGVPLKQGIAVTGSMNQRGEVQPIGGVNQKIEGFYDVCKVRGLTGGQGVIIPRRNVRNLMLKREVVEAVEEGRFAIYPIDMVDDGLEILTGMEAGARGGDGAFPDGTVNRLAEQRLGELARKIKEFGRGPAKKSGDASNNGNNSNPGQDKGL